MNKRYSKLGKNTILLFIGNFASKLLSFFLVPLYTYYLTTSEYGISDLLSTTVSLLVPFLTLVASEAVLRFTLDKEIDKAQILTISNVITCCGFFLLLLISPLLQKVVPFSDYYHYFLLDYIFMALATNLEQFVKGLEHIFTFVFCGVLQTLVSISLNILLLVVFNMGIKGYLIAIITSSAAVTIFITIKERIWRYWVKPFSISKRLWHEYILFCLPLVPNSLSWWISDSSDKYILQLFWGASLTGIYSVSYKIPSIISTISGIFTGAWQISAVDDFGSDESNKFISGVYDKYSSLFFASAPLIVLFTRPLAKFLFSKDFFNAWPYSVILIYSAAFHSLAGFLGVIYTTARKTRMIFVTTLLGAVGNIIMNFAFIPRWGAYGAAVATLISYILVWLVRLFDSRKIVPIQLKLKRDIICYVLFVLQGITTVLQLPGYLLISGFIVIAELVINRRLVGEMIRIIMTRFSHAKA